MERRCQLEDRVLGRSGARPCRCAPAVFVVGASSTGKTTLCMALAKELGVGDDRWIREVARNVMKTQGFSRDRTQEYEMQHAIMTAQLQAEERVLSNVEEKQSSLLLSDRSAVDPTVYALTSGVAEAQPNHQRLLQDPAFQATLPFYRRSLFGTCRARRAILCPISDAGQSSFSRFLNGWRTTVSGHWRIRGTTIPISVQL